MTELLGVIQSHTVIAIGMIFGLAALGTGVGFAILGGKFIESSARQPEMMGALQTRMFIVAGLLDAVSIIGVAMGMLLMFANPLVSADVKNAVDAQAKVIATQAATVQISADKALKAATPKAEEAAK